ncbi:MAG: aspartyl-phosphate phosphatase Spo0E family protein [Firmicutes bacterium]|nr:aspartyl-phosphate phosphatase Spo0E family protein [Bacillota bacterium]
MRKLGKEKQVRQKIKYLQKKLDNAVENSQLTSYELLELSKELDKLIVDYYNLNDNSKC